MRVVLTTHQFFPDFCSGTEVLTLGVARELLRRGHEVCVFTGYPEIPEVPEQDRYDAYEFEGIDVYRFRHSFAPMGGQKSVAEMEYSNRLAERYFSRILRERRPDLVHFFHFSRLGSGLIDIAAEAGVAGFYTPTDFWAVCPTSQLLLSEGTTCEGPGPSSANCVKHIATKTRHGRYRGLIRLLPLPVVGGLVDLIARGLLPEFPHTDDVNALAHRLSVNIGRLNRLNAVLAPTRMMADVLLKNGVNNSIVSEVSYGIDLRAFATSRPRRTGATLTLGFIGTLARHKGCHLLIKAVRNLAAPSLRLKIYGKQDDYPDYFAELVSLAGADARIEFCGTFPNGHIGAILGSIDALVVPSIWFENSPLVVYSALAAKCPVVASDFPGVAEIIRHGENGLLFEPASVTGLTAQLAALVTDPDLQPRLSAACRPPKTVEVYVDELLDCWSTRKPPRSAAPPVPLELSTILQDAGL